LPKLWEPKNSSIEKTALVADLIPTTKQYKQLNPSHRNPSLMVLSVFYEDGEKFARVYTSKAAGFAVRQKNSPVVKVARVTEVS
jgi:hypothetical protein